jgi:putative Mg2+ transporter-C (MgtC) family protein
LFDALDPDSPAFWLRLGTAILCGGIIGLERQLRGKAAGIRTSILICLGTEIFVSLGSSFPTGTSDPTRVVGQVVTGIGFLGAGVIFKEGLTVRGLTTAASIWITAAIGILLGIGFYFAATVGAIATLAVLAAFRFVEHRLPAEFYAHHSLTFQRSAIMSEEDLRRLIADHGFSIANLSYRLSNDGKLFEYGMVIKTRDSRNAEALAQHLCRRPEVLEFRIAPTGD